MQLKFTDGGLDLHPSIRRHGDATAEAADLEHRRGTRANAEEVGSISRFTPQQERSAVDALVCTRTDIEPHVAPLGGRITAERKADARAGRADLGQDLPVETAGFFAVQELPQRTVQRRARQFGCAVLTSESQPRRVDVLDSILINLIDNARRHGGPGVEVEIRAESRGGFGRIEVIDDGPGISESNLARVFERFFTTRRDEGGSGLGLPIVRSLIEAHGGRIEVFSRPGRTTVVLSAPLPTPEGSPGRLATAP